MKKILVSKSNRIENYNPKETQINFTGVYTRIAKYFSPFSANFFMLN